MTSYDPFSYGQVRIDNKSAPAADSPDDMLFADAGPQKTTAAGADASWSLLGEDVDSLLPSSSPSVATAMEFGAEILGEVPMPAAAKSPAPARPRAATAPQPSPRAGAAAADGTNAEFGRQSARAEPMEVRAKVKPEGAPKAAVSKPVPAAAGAPRAPAELPRRRGHPLASILAPFGLAATGGTAACWFAITQQNPVMAGIVGLLAVVAAAIAWLTLRP
jgi:hypothetical protein